MTGLERVLVIRTWSDGDLRARVLGVDVAAGPVPPGVVASGVDDICSAVRAWLVLTGVEEPREAAPDDHDTS